MERSKPRPKTAPELLVEFAKQVKAYEKGRSMKMAQQHREAIFRNLEESERINWPQVNASAYFLRRHVKNVRGAQGLIVRAFEQLAKGDYKSREAESAISRMNSWADSLVEADELLLKMVKFEKSKKAVK